ncbi:MAG: DUF6034 family protein [Christensenellales bacterium]
MKKKCTKMLALLLILLALFAATGCQPTPDEPPVVGKNNTNALVEGTEAPYEVPTHWKEQKPITLNDLTVEIDADIVMPDVTKIPVYSVKDKRFTQEEADKIIAVLSEGKQLYSPTETRADAERSLLEHKKELKRLKEADVSAFGSEEARETRIYVCEQMIKETEKQLKELPETVVEEPPVLVFKRYIYENFDYGDRIAVSVDLGKAERAGIGIKNGTNEDNPSSFIAFSNGSSYEAYNEAKHEVLAEDGLPVGLKTTKEQAIAQAQAMLDKLGITYMKLSLIRPAYLRDVYTQNVYENIQGWQVIYTRVAEGIPVMFLKDMYASGRSFPASNDSSYNTMYEYEEISFYIDDTGITRIDWIGPMEFLDTLNENVKLIAFSEIQQRVREQLPKKYAGKALSETTLVHVNSMKLEYMRVRVKDSQTDYMLIPVWNVYGYNNTTSFPGGKPKLNPQNYTETLLTINATDGSVIDAYKGY